MREPRPLVVVEDDRFTRLIEIALDPDAEEARVAAFERFFAHELPDFSGWLGRLRDRLRHIYPSQVRMVADQEALADALPQAHAAVVEGLALKAKEIAHAPALKAVHKFGTIVANIDTDACSARGVRVLTLRRRANIACAEHALGMLLALARRMCETDGLISVAQLERAGHCPAQFDRTHTANSNWARVTGIRTLYGATLGIAGLGEIGRELARRAAACGMRIIYTQRHRLGSEEETHYGARYAVLDDLLREADCVSLHLPGNAATRGIISERELRLLKPDALLVNVSRADLVDRTALLDALASRHLGGFATDLPYEEPGREDDPLLRFPNVVMTPHIAAQPRFNALDDIAELLTNLDAALAPPLAPR